MAGLLIVIVIFDRARARLASVAPSTVQRNLPATDAPYWAAMLVAGTLGTASGDFTAGTLGLGLGLGSIILAAIFAFVLLISVRIGRMTKPWYWASIVAARSAGTTMGDFVANQHGLNLGLSLSTVCTCGLLVAIVLLWSNEPRAAVPQPEQLLPARSREKIHHAAQAASQRGE